MDQTKMDLLVKKLETPDNTGAYGEEVCNELSNLFNCFGSYSKMMNELYSKLSGKARELLNTFMYSAAVYMADEYIRTEGCWDERKKASMEFAMANQDFFKRKFEAAIGYPITFIPNVDERQILPRKCDIAMWKANNTFAVPGFMRAWCNTHSTLKQAIFGGWVRSVLSSDVEMGTTADAACFPFI